VSQNKASINQNNKAHFGVGLGVESPHAAQHGGEVMRRTLVELERLMLPQTSEAARAHMQTKEKQAVLGLIVCVSAQR
jgi:hypothetical protein